MKKKYDFKNAKRGAVVPQKGKTRITISLDADVSGESRNLADGAGCGCQTMINGALRLYLGKALKPVD